MDNYEKYIKPTTKADEVKGKMNITIDISLTDKEAQKLYDIMPEGRFKEFVLKRYIEKKPLKAVCLEMYYTERHIYKIANDVRELALKLLLEEAVASEV